MVLGVSPAWGGECVVAEDFSKGKVGELPPDWKLKKDSGRGVYSLVEERGLRFLRAVSRGIGVQAAKPYEWDVQAYPILAWSWRPLEFPAGADERNSKTNDSAVAVYAVFPHTSWSVKSVKYVWSVAVPVGTRISSSAGLTQGRVLRNGPNGKGEWVEERVNVLEDYRKFFGEAEVPKPAGIAVITDSDDTRSRARGDYANFRVCRP
ncbi:MAG TPA: DUF3047 domain-containing protein [Methylomirabilota bacterium]|nr:DUF3047 domain-containing protein [Methylomirabilota bacterium]